MAEQRIEILQSFSAPLHVVFELLTDHQQFGNLLGANIKRVKNADGDYINGLGSVRRITIMPGMSFEETVVEFEPDAVMAYRVSKGGPIKSHLGRMLFSESPGGKSSLVYTIVFEPKLPLPFAGTILKKAIEIPIRKGLAKLEKQFLSQ